MTEFIDILYWMVENPIKGFILLFVEYALIFSMYHQKKLRWLAKIAAIPFVIQDAVVNIFVLTPLFLEWPKEWLVTARLHRWKINTPVGKRQKIRGWFAWKVCDQLNKYDPNHC